MFRRFCFFCFLLLPLIGHLSPVCAANPGDVVINELMWMGTAASSSDEWIELLNTSEQNIDLTNWILKSEDGTPQIFLSGIIPAKGYYLLERSDDNTIIDIPADKIYSGALSDSGENLVIYDSYTVIIDSAPCSAGWFSGGKSPNYSMERINPQQGGWLAVNWGNNDGNTICGSDANSNSISATPKVANSILYAGDPYDPGSGGEGDPVQYTLRITEVSFSDIVDWVEVYNYGTAGIDISHIMLTDLDGTDSRVAEKQTTLPAGQYAVIHWDENGVDETDDVGDINHNSVLDLYVQDTSLSATDDQIVLVSASQSGVYLDAVCWSDLDGNFASGEKNDVELLRTQNMWTSIDSFTEESDCWTDSDEVINKKTIGRISNSAPDTNSKEDWRLLPGPTPGEDNVDSVAPKAIADLAAVSGIYPGEITLTWTASGDNGNIGVASSYIVFYSTAEDMSSTAVYEQTWIPRESGQTEDYVLQNFLPGQVYYIAIQIRDDFSNMSSLSNVTKAQARKALIYAVLISEVSFASATDWAELYNYGNVGVDISSFTLTDLDGSDSSLASGKVTLAPGKYAVVWWDENGVDETDAMGDTNGNGVIDLYVADTGLSATDDQIALMNAVSGGDYLDAVCWSNQNGEFSSDAFNDAEVLRVNSQWQIAADTVTESDCVSSQNIDVNTSIGRISPAATDTNSKDDWYVFSNQTPGRDNPDIIPPQSVSDLAGQPGEHEGEIILAWTASGDDGSTGRAARYELRYSTSPDMTGGAILAQDWTPVEPGNEESQIMAGLMLNTPYYFSLTVFDEAGNASASSAIATAISQHDLTPPEVEISFNPSPPFTSGRIKVILKITDLSALLAEPLFSCQIGTGPAAIIALRQRDSLWEGEIELPPSISEREVVFTYAVQDEFGNYQGDSLTYSCLKLEIQATDGQEEFTYYPNPFSPTKGEKITFCHPGDADYTLEIFSLDGVLIFSQTGAGPLSWDGKNNAGGTVASGIYGYRFYSCTWQKKGKIAVLK